MSVRGVFNGFQWFSYFFIRKSFGIQGQDRKKVKLDAMVTLLRKAGISDVSKYRSEAVANIFETSLAF